MVGIDSVWVVNASGGLAYMRRLREGRERLRTNEQLRLASLVHSMHTVASEVSPVEGCEGIEVMSSNELELHMLRAPTGTTFLVAADASASGVRSFLWKVYELYSDYCLKDPFHEADMPIHSSPFDTAVRAAAHRS